ncbi:MAG: hypothetical protein M3R35_07950, partial [Candidatus Eremiobacteraeota bacterium]|nr:hypothetical protein [Candidatus Eremiobacteraeota bacterium]
MGFNLLGAITGAASGFLEGGPYGAAAMGIAGGLAGGGSTAGNMIGGISNAGLGALNAQDEMFQLSMYAQEMHHSEQMQMQSEAFNEATDEKSEQMREINTLRDVSMAQRKADT